LPAATAAAAAVGRQVLACLRSLLERVHHVAAVFQQFLLAGVDVLVGGTRRVDRRLAIFQPVSNFACLDAFAGIVGALTERTVTLVGRCLSESLLEELGSAHVLVASVLLVLHQHQLAVRPLLLGQEVPHCVLLKLEDGHQCGETGEVGAGSRRCLPCVSFFFLVFPSYASSFVSV